ncbi:MAG: TolC family protein [Bacteroidetes bacterium]|nr:TolC family protein [Bacteroidota bacterium]
MKTLQIFILFILSGLFVQAQEPLSLTNAITIALENNYDIRIVKQNQRIAEITNDWGTAGRYPYINLLGGADNSANVNNNENFVSNRFSAGASLNWTLFDGYSVRINKQRFEELEQLSKQNTAIMVEGTIQSVVLAYYDVLLQKEKLNTYNEVMSLSEDRFKQAESRKEYGAAVTYEVLQAQNAYLSDRTGYLLQEVNYKNSLRDLSYLMADNSETNYNLTDNFEAIPVEYALADLQAQMTSNNKGLQNQYVNQRLLENAIAAAKSNFSPTIDFRGGATANSTRNNFADRGETWNNSANFYGNFTLSYNLFSGGNRKRASQIAQIDEEVGLVKIDDMKHDLNNSLSKLYEFYLVRKELLDIADENMKAAKLNLQISQEKFDAGAINSFNFRDVQTIYLNASQRRLEAIYYFIDAHTSMLRMAGVIVQEYE